MVQFNQLYLVCIAGYFKFVSFNSTILRLSALVTLTINYTLNIIKANAQINQTRSRPKAREMFRYCMVLV